MDINVCVCVCREVGTCMHMKGSEDNFVELALPSTLTWVWSSKLQVYMVSASPAASCFPE